MKIWFSQREIKVKGCNIDSIVLKWERKGEREEKEDKKGYFKISFLFKNSIRIVFLKAK